MFCRSFVAYYLAMVPIGHRFSSVGLHWAAICKSHGRLIVFRNFSKNLCNGVAGSQMFCIFAVALGSTSPQAGPIAQLVRAPDS